MPLIVNLRHLRDEPLRFQGELPAADLDVEGIDPQIRVVGPLQHDLEVDRQGRGLLVRGRLELNLECECARCLRPFTKRLVINDWCALLAFEGEEAAEIRNDCVDLTPHIREDIVLALPQRPLCEPECRGFKDEPRAGARPVGGAVQDESTSSAWATLNKLKL